MLRRLAGAVVLTCLLSTISAPIAESEPARTSGMQFALHQESGACGDACRTLIAASGMIKADTVQDFEAFAARHDLRGATLVLHSEGGSVHGALALGRAVRRLGLTTTVGRMVESSTKPAALLPRGDCESMCAFVLLGGSKRSVPQGAEVRVHQIWLGDRRDDATAATYSAEDLVLVQRDIGKIAQYTIEMGGNIELLEVALRIPPWEPMKALSRAELRRMLLDNAESTETPATPPMVINTAPATTGSVRRMSTRPGRAAGWAVAERGGQQVLTRGHPLTVEGDDIGRFDVSIACGDKPNEYLVTYSETRRARAGVAPAPLKEVQVRLGYKTVTLALKSSELTANAAERVSLASGVLTAAMVTNFAGSGARSLTVDALTADGVSANIRVGNTGAAQQLPQLSTSCAQTRSEHAKLQAK